MPILTIPRNYKANEPVLESYLDAALDSIESFLNVTKLDDINIQAASITASSKVSDGTVTVVTLAAEAITTSKIDANAVTAAALNSDTAGTGLSQATDGELDVVVDDSTVEVDPLNGVQIKDLGITRAKLDSNSSEQLSSNSGTFTTNSSTLSDVTNLSVSITTTGRPVLIQLVGPSSPAANWVGISIPGAGSGFNHAALIFVRDSEIIGSAGLATEHNSDTKGLKLPSQTFMHVDQPAAGTYTYKVQAATKSSGTTLTVYNCRLKVLEI